MDKWMGMESPRWMRISLYVLKWIMVMIPFVVSSIALFYEPNMSISESGIWNCIWMISLIKIIDMSDE